MEKRNIFLTVAIVIIICSIVYLERNDSSSTTQQTNSNTDAGATSNSESVNTEIKPANQPSTKVIDKTKYPLAPELKGISGYLNTGNKTIHISDYRGKVVLVDFWTYTCINCIRTLPYLTSWDDKYRDKGFVIIGIQAPEFEFEKEYANVLDAVTRYGLKYPVVLDNDHKTWNAFNNRYWPAKYLIDKDGYIRYTHFGEGAYEETEKKIQELLLETGQDTTNTDLTTGQKEYSGPITPELYAGLLFSLPRGQYIGNKKESYATETYILPQEISKSDIIYLNGSWYNTQDDLQLKGNEGIISLKFTGSEIHIVAQPQETSSNVTMEILIDGAPLKSSSASSDVHFEENRALIDVNQKRLYTLFKGTYGEHRIDIHVSKGFSFNSFTFG